MNGPNGITLSLSLRYIIKDKGNAIKDDKNIVKVPKTGPRTIPTKSINFTSPPPRLSFLKRKFPNNINKYIKTNIPNPDNTDKDATFIPSPAIFTAITNIEKNNVTSSGITK